MPSHVKQVIWLKKKGGGDKDWLLWDKYGTWVAKKLELFKYSILYLCHFETQNCWHFMRTCFWAGQNSEMSWLEWYKRILMELADEICQNGGFPSIEVWKS